MKHYIFDREKDAFLIDKDGEKIHFPDNESVYNYLSKGCQFKDQWIKENYYSLKAVKILIPEEVEPLPENDLWKEVGEIINQYRDSSYIHPVEILQEKFTIARKEVNT